MNQQETNAFVMGYSSYWDCYSINCMDGVGMFDDYQMAAFKEGFISARKEDKGR